MMSKLLWRSLFVSPVILGVTLLFPANAVRAAEAAETQVTKTPATPLTSETLASVTSNSEVTPTYSIAVPREAEEFPQASPLPLTTVPATESPIAQAAPVADNEDVLEQINRYSQEGRGNARDQVTNVSQLSDVSPGDWAFEALRSLVERYGCIAGYPDGTYRGNRAMTRYEFAAGLNACLQQIESLIAGLDFVTREDLETLQRLIQEFEAELATLGTRVDNLEGRVAFLEDNQFSTTTKLAGEVIFALTDTFPDESETFSLSDAFGGVLLNPVTGLPVIDPTTGLPVDDITVGNDTETIFGDRVRLELNTSFTGRDRLVTRLSAGNLSAFTPNSFQFIDAAGNTFDISTGEATQTFNLGESGNDVLIDWLAYYFTFGSSQIYIAANGGIHSDYVPTLNPFFEDFDGGDGALSTFASESPIYRIGGGAGGAISLGVGPLERLLGPSTLTVGYLAGPGANDPTEDNGVVNGEYSVLGQLNFNIGDRIAIGGTYVHAYHNSGNAIFDLGGGGTQGIVGSFAANNPGILPVVVGRDATPTVTNSYGVQAALRLTDNISISGFGAYTDAILIGEGDAEIWTYGGGVAISDLGKEGSVLGIFGGAQPYAGIIDVPGETFRVDDVPYHVEAFYKYQVTDNISVTPGVIWLLAPNQVDSDIVIGTLRTTFSF
jgi:BMFP domain-containing protein YqiC